MYESGVSFFGQTTEGKRRIRTVPNMFLKPGDVCVYGTGEDSRFVVGQIAIWVDIQQATMEVIEA